MWKSLTTFMRPGNMYQIRQQTPLLPSFYCTSATGDKSKVRKKAVIFDMGGVLIPSPFKIFQEFEKTQNLPAGLISRVVVEKNEDSAWAKLENGQLSMKEFAAEFSSQCSEKAGQNVDTSQLLSSFMNANFIPYPDMIDAVQCVKAEGFKTALLTNIWFYAPGKTYIPVDKSLFDVIIESCKVKMRKPDPKIYELCLEQLSVKPGEAVFLDDLGHNLKAAKAMGITTIKVTSPEQAIRDLEGILGFPLRGFVNGTVAVHKHLKLPVDKLVPYLNSTLNLNSQEEPLMRSFKSGQSNPTYYVNYGGKEMVLRKKPPGKLLPSAHAVDREYRMLNTVGKHGVPVPRTLAYCKDESVIGTEFYLMDYMKGRVLRDPTLASVKKEDRRGIYYKMIDVLSKIHSIDIKKAGLQDYGKPGDYVKRNFQRWVKQYQSSKTDDIPEMDKLIEWIPQHLPTDERITLVHGDFRLDNLIYDDVENKPIGTLDWELSTIGDPITDLATCCFVYYLSPEHFLLKGLSGLNLEELGLPTVEELVAEYCHKCNIPLIKNWDFYVVFTFFRFSAILQGVYKRAISGQSSSPLGKLAGPFVKEGCETGWEIAKRSNLQPTLQTTSSGKTGVREYSTLIQNHLSSPLNRRMSTDSSAAQMPITLAALSPKVQDLHKKIKAFVDENVIPAEHDFVDPNDIWKVSPLMEKLKAKAKSENLWNLFLPVESDPQVKYGAGLTNLEYAFLCEEMGKSVYASEVFNCSAPDTGNMEVLVKYGTEEQKEKWLKPLLDGKIRSCFAMTEPKVASSDATNIESSIEKDGDHYIINGHKWWTSGACHPNCKISIFMGKTNPKESLHRQQSMILVPMDAPGVKILRPLNVFGGMDPPAGHAEVLFENVRVPASNMLLGEGRGFEIAQGRLGPGRIHHCMRLIGQAERALELMAQRVQDRTAFGKKLAEQGTIQADIAKSRMEIEQARLLVLKAAHMMDIYGNKVAAPEIAMIKVAVPNMALRVVDRAIQAFGGAGFHSDLPLAEMYTWARVLKIADGPDEVHLRSIAKMEFSKQNKKKLSKL